MSDDIKDKDIKIGDISPSEYIRGIKNGNIDPTYDNAVKAILWAADEIERLKTALDESVNLQSHYAELLNMHDGGKRLTFANAQEWIARLMP